MNQKWDTTLYDNNHSFVSAYGEELIKLLNPVASDKILDLGCGTGDLTSEIAKYGSDILGIDASKEMIEKAKYKFSDIPFRVEDAIDLNYQNEFDGIISNAVLHWIKSPTKVLESVYSSLKVGGRFVAEFGGKDNCNEITSTIINIINETTFKFNPSKFPWYFPSIGEYTTLMENIGFKVKLATHFDRPTKLSNNSEGLKSWISMFSKNLFTDIPAEMVPDIVEETESRLESKLKQNDTWYADYKRIRVFAIK